MAKVKESYIQVKKVSETLDCSDDFVRNLIRDGELKAINLGARALRISVHSLNRYIKKREVDPKELIV